MRVFFLVFVLILGCESTKFSHESSIHIETSNGSPTLVVVGFPDVIVDNRKDLESVIQDLKFIISRLETISFGKRDGRTKDLLEFKVELSNLNGKFDKVSITTPSVQAVLENSLINVC